MNTFKGDLPNSIFGVEIIEQEETKIKCPSCKNDEFEDAAIKDFPTSPYGETEEVIYRDFWSCNSCGTVIRPPKEKRRFESPLMFLR